MADITKTFIEQDTNSFKKEIRSDKFSRVQIEVGDSKEEKDFKPQCKIMAWDNETNFSIRAEECEDATVESTDGKFKYKTPKYEVHMYEKPEAGEDGGFEFEWVLKEKPKSNVLTATIRTKGLNFFYQPELTEKEIEEGDNRPENVIGSYAVYHEEKTDNYSAIGGKNYMVGKAFHIYRPEAVDDKGNKTWCELNVNKENELLTVTVPQEFLDKATYPVVVDPTFGLTTVGSSNSSRSNYLRGPVRTGAAGTGVSMSSHCYGVTDSPSYLALYLESDDSLVANSAQFNVSNSIGWQSANFLTSPTLSAVDYALILFIGANTVWQSYDSTTCDYRQQSRTFSLGLPDPASFSDETNRLFSIYCTYTESASEEVGKLNNIAIASIGKIKGVAKASVGKVNGVSI